MSYIKLARFEVEMYYRHRLSGLRQRGNKWRGPCPVHNGKHDNFAADSATGRWFCHSQCNAGGDIFDLEGRLSGCDFTEAVRKVSEIIGRDFSSRDEFDLDRPISHSDQECQHEERCPRQVFEYANLNGICQFKVHRQDCRRCRKKFIWQAKPDGTPDLDGVEPILFNWRAVEKADTVYIVEGEPKVLALAEWGLTATCNPGGAGKWSSAFTSELFGKKIIILPDNDKPGRQHAINIARLLAWDPVVHILELPELSPKGDILDWKEAGHTKDELLALVAASEPETLESIRTLEIEWGLASPVGQETGEIPESRNEVEPFSPEAFYGVAGDFVRLVEPHTEADPAALLGSFLVAAGNYLSRNTYYRADGSKHFSNEFLAIVGDSSKGRKGTSWNRVRDVLTIIDPDYVKNRITSGLSSGEGVIFAVRDEGVAQQPANSKGGK